MPLPTPLPKPLTPKVLFLADSRGRNLDADLSCLLGNTFTLVFYPGATIMDTLYKSEHIIKRKEWSQIYCLAGICDMTIKNRTSHTVSIRSSDTGLLVSDYMNTLHQAHSTIRQWCPQVRVKCIFCPVTRLNFSAYNKRPSHLDDLTNQVALNESIAHLNAEIMKYNTLNKNITPWTSRAVHRRHRNSVTNNYDRLANDGCHLSPAVRQFWADALHEAVVKNS